MKQTLTTPNTLPSQPIAALLLTAVFLWTAGPAAARLGITRYAPLGRPSAPNTNGPGKLRASLFPLPAGVLPLDPNGRGQRTE